MKTDGQVIECPSIILNYSTSMSGINMQNNSHVISKRCTHIRLSCWEYQLIPSLVIQKFENPSNLRCTKKKDEIKCIVPVVWTLMFTRLADGWGILYPQNDTLGLQPETEGFNKFIIKHTKFKCHWWWYTKCKSQVDNIYPPTYRMLVLEF